MNKISPIEMVANEMSMHSEMSQNDILDSLKNALNSLRKRAADAIVEDSQSDLALRASKEYRAISELINFFGSQLIAFEDLDREDADRIKN